MSAGRLSLFENYPRPWRIQQDETVDPQQHIGGYVVLAANGAVVLDGGTFTGDGDTEVNMNRLQAAELVMLVNSSR